MVYTICMSVQKKEKRWIKNSPTIIVINSIFAAIAGILFVFAVTAFVCPKDWGWSLPFIISFFLFSWTAERTTDAIDKKDTEKYIAYMLPYNIGVVLLFLGIWLIFFHIYNFSLELFLVSSFFCLCFSIFFFTYFRTYPWLVGVPLLIMVQIVICLVACHWWSFCLKNALVSGFAGFAFLIFSSPWLADSWWLLSLNEIDFNKYKEELDGHIEPTVDTHIWQDLFYGLRTAMQFIINNVVNRIKKG